MKQEIVVVETTSGMIEAEILRSLLQSHDIEVWLSGESAATAVGLGVGPLAIVDVLVRADQQADALEILEAYRLSGQGGPEPTNDDPGP